MPRVLVGVDGGGTKTHVVVLPVEADHERALPIGEAFTGSSNFHTVGLEPARIAVQDGIAQALNAAGCSMDEVDGICLGMAGVDRPGEDQIVREWIQELPSFSSVPLRVHNDAMIALASGTRGVLEGIVIICGTGTITFGVNASGSTTRASGWGPKLGDEGSGYWIGSQMLKAIVRTEDGRGANTTLLPEVLGHLKIKEASQLIDWAYSDTNKVSDIASIAPIAFKCAQGGDKVASDILSDACGELADAIDCVAWNLGLSNAAQLNIVIAGGILCEPSGRMRSGLSSQLAATYGRKLVQIIAPKISSAHGAALLAGVPQTSSGLQPARNRRRDERNDHVSGIHTSIFGMAGVAIITATFCFIFSLRK
jgi:N-acetylglucosamine kinase-like BadF-type ATPase